MSSTSSFSRFGTHDGGKCSVDGPEGEELAPPSQFASLCSRYRSEELSIGPVKSARLAAHTIHSCKALGKAGPGSTICRRNMEAHEGTSGRH